MPNFKNKFILPVITLALFLGFATPASAQTFNCVYNTGTFSCGVQGGGNGTCPVGYFANPTVCTDLTSQGQGACNAMQNVPCSTTVVPTPTFGLPATQGPWYNQNALQFGQKVKGGDQNEIFGERYTFAQVNWIINSLYLMLDPMSGLTSADLSILVELMRCLMVPCTNAPQGNLQWSLFAMGGFPGLFTGGIIEMQARPLASGVREVSNTLAKYNIATPAYAQGGYGFQTLDSLRILWGASRNMAYLLMVILLITTGFMIMFRVKINPQTAVSLQIMIPKVITTLLLVTFSYAIAGLVIDMVYVLLSFIISGMTLTGAIDPGNLAGSVAWFFHPDYARIVYYYFGAWLGLIAQGGIAGIINTVFTAISGNVGAALIAGLGGVFATILSIVMIVIIIWLLFRVWWMMLRTYITLMFLIVVGPWQIMLGLLPGQQGFGAWFRNIIANASVFLTVPIMFMLNMYFWPTNPLSPLGTVAGVSFTNFSLPDFPLFGSKGTIFSLAIGYAILSMIPKIAEIIRDALKVPPFKYGTAFGEALGPISMAGKAGLGGYSSGISAQIKEAETRGGTGFWYRAGLHAQKIAADAASNQLPGR